MVKDIRRLLMEIAKSGNAGELASLFAKYYPRIKEVKNKSDLFELIVKLLDLDAVIEIDTLDVEEAVASTNRNFEGCDLRIQAVSLSALRGIPEANDSQIHFGINFIDSGNISNAIILANNGVGKSSIFAGLEMVYAQEIGERQIRSNSTVEKEKFIHYLQRFGSSKLPYCAVRTPVGEFSITNPIFDHEADLKRYNPANHFISDYDIYNYGKVDFDGDENNQNSFHNLIARSLGLAEFIDFQNTLRELGTYRRQKEKSSWQNAVDEKNENERTIANLNAEIAQKKQILTELETSNSEEIPKDRSRQKEIKDAILSLSTRSLEELHIDKDLSIVKSDFKNEYSNYISTEDNPNRLVERDFLRAGEKLLNESEDCPFCQHSKLSLEELREYVNERLRVLGDKVFSENSLREKYMLLVDKLHRSLTNLTTVYNQIFEERRTVQTINELGKLSDLENAFILKYAPIVADEEMYLFLEKRRNKFNVSNEDYEALLNFINGPVINNLEEIIIEMDQLISTRAESFNSFNTSPITEDTRAIIKEDIRRFEHQIEKANKRITELGPEIEKNKYKMAQVEYIKTQVQKYVPILELEISNMVKEAFEPIHDIVENIMADYLIETDLTLNIDLKTTVIENEDGEFKRETIVANITDKVSGKNITPDKYLNSFRYKLFNLMICLSLALATRKKYRINLPLVLDDLFAASDFINKNSFSEFLIKVIDLFLKYTPDLPLQFIMFTHDDIIFRSAIDTLDFYQIPEDLENVLHIENKQALVDKTKVGRIFKIESSDLSVETSSIGDKYYNVFYSLPNFISID